MLGIQEVPDSLDPAYFRLVLGHYPSGVVAITGRNAEGAPVGMVATSFTSVSLDPPLVAFLPMRTSTTWAALRETGAFCVNVLPAEQEHISRQLAAKGGDKFGGIAWRTETTGSPVLAGAVAWVDCTVSAVHEAGDHFIVVGLVEDLAIGEPASPLLSFQGGYGTVASPALAASGVPDLPEVVEHFRLVDELRPRMAQASRELGVEVVATALLEDEVVALATSGHPEPGRLPTRVGQRMPYQPPLGAAFAAWSDPKRWVARLPNEQREHARALARRVRERGWSATLGESGNLDLERALYRLPIDAPSPEELDAVGQLLDPLSEAYEPHTFTTKERIPLRTVAVPVLGPVGTIRLVLTAYGLPPYSTYEDFVRYRDTLLDIAGTVQTLSA
ncbi:flavin reductase [Streptomyces sp. NPDC018026]|uniref:flavin reductase n=1 Tax=Streptomyces sp. NPDC018026 TaxID=3365031 RepID=UPI00379E511D